jgi:hypothetical protein
MYLKFVKSVVVCGVPYTDGQTVSLSEIPQGSVRSLIRGGQVVAMDELPKTPEPVLAEQAPVETTEPTKPASKKAPK